MPRTRYLMILLASLASAPAWPAAYELDPGLTLTQFEIDHLWLFTQHGWFDRARSALEYDVEARNGRLEVVIDASSLQTGNDERDAALKGPDWFDVGRHPSISFHSQRFIFEQERLTAIEGELTMRGVTQPLRLEITRIQCGARPASGRSSCRADASGTLQRSRFGMRASLPFIGDEVRLRIRAEAYPKH